MASTLSLLQARLSLFSSATGLQSSATGLFSSAIGLFLSVIGLFSSVIGLQSACFCLQLILKRNISNILNTMNKTLEELDHQLSFYHKDVKNHTYLFYGSRYDSECHVKNICNIQKELQVYHYHKEATLKLLCEMFCSKNINIFKLCQFLTCQPKVKMNNKLPYMIIIIIISIS